MNWSCVDLCCYINLKHQTDRRQHIEHQLDSIGFPREKTQRIDAVHKPLNGFQGNCLSHLEVLNFAIEQGVKNVLILEDDSSFIKPQSEIISYIDNCIQHFKNGWDILLLGVDLADYEDTTHAFYKRVLLGGLQSAYLVNERYFEKLSSFYIWAYENVLIREVFSIQSLINVSQADGLWQLMQKKDFWVTGTQYVAQQRIEESSLSLQKGGRFIQHTVDNLAQYKILGPAKHWDLSSSPFEEEIPRQKNGV